MPKPRRAALPRLPHGGCPSWRSTQTELRCDAEHTAPSHETRADTPGTEAPIRRTWVVRLGPLAGLVELARRRVERKRRRLEAGREQRHPYATAPVSLCSRRGLLARAVRARPRGTQDTWSRGSSARQAPRSRRPRGRPRGSTSPPRSRPRRAFARWTLLLPSGDGVRPRRMVAFGSAAVERLRSERNRNPPPYRRWTNSQQCSTRRRLRLSSPRLKRRAGLAVPATRSVQWSGWRSPSRSTPFRRGPGRWRWSPSTRPCAPLSPAVPRCRPSTPAIASDQAARIRRPARRVP